jgi:hypothetical protein
MAMRYDGPNGDVEILSNSPARATAKFLKSTPFCRANLLPVEDEDVHVSATEVPDHVDAVDVERFGDTVAPLLVP